MMKKLVSSIVLLLTISVAFAVDNYKKVACTGGFRGHLQGIEAHNGKIFWSHTHNLIRTDSNGVIEKYIDAPYHHGDICIHNNKLYVAVNLGVFDQKKGAKNSVWIYDLDLNFIKKIPIKEFEGGLGGIEYYNGSFYLVGGIHNSYKQFPLYKYDENFNLQKEYLFDVAETVCGIQTICWAYGRFWLGVYLNKESIHTNLRLWETDENLKIIKKHKIDASTGITPIENADGANFLIARAHCKRQKLPEMKYSCHWAEVYPLKIIPTETK